MPHSLTLGRRLWTAAQWPVGIGLTSWNYMWRTTPLHRGEECGTVGDRRDAGVSQEALVARLGADLNCASPTELARFFKTSGASGTLANEVQLHMWTSFLERIVELAGGRITGGIEIVSRKLQVPDAPA